MLRSVIPLLRSQRLTDQVTKITRFTIGKLSDVTSEARPLIVKIGLWAYLFGGGSELVIADAVSKPDVLERARVSLTTEDSGGQHRRLPWSRVKILIRRIHLYSGLFLLP